MANWGRTCWEIIHALACALPNTKENANWLLGWFRNVVSILPCEKCQMHAMHTLSTQRVIIADMVQLKQALWQFHNSINSRKGTRIFPYASYESIHSNGIILHKLRAFNEAIMNTGKGRRDFIQGMARKRTCNRLTRQAYEMIMSQLAH